MRGLVKKVKPAIKSSFEDSMQKRSTNTIVDAINIHSVHSRLIQVENNYQKLNTDIIVINQKVTNLEKNLDKFIIHTDAKFAKMDEICLEIQKSITVLGERVNNLGERVNSLGERVNGFEKKFQIIYGILGVLLFADDEDKKMIKHTISDFIIHKH